MATPSHGKATKIYFDSLRVSQMVSGGGLGFGADSAEVPKLEDDPKDFLQGKAGVTESSLNGFADYAAAGWDTTEFSAINDGIHFLARCPQGNTQNSLVYETREYSTGDSRAYDQAGIGMLNWNGQGSGQFTRGVVLTAGEEAFTATGLTTGTITGTTTPSDTLIATLRLVSVTGTGTCAFQIHESSDDGAADAYANITGWSAEEPGAGSANVSFAANTVTFTGVGSIQLTVSATTEQYKDVYCSTFSGFTSVSLITTIGTRAT